MGATLSKVEWRLEQIPEEKWTTHKYQWGEVLNKKARFTLGIGPNTLRKCRRFFKNLLKPMIITLK